VTPVLWRITCDQARPSLRSTLQFTKYTGSSFFYVFEFMDGDGFFTISSHWSKWTENNGHAPITVLCYSMSNFEENRGVSRNQTSQTDWQNFFATSIRLARAMKFALLLGIYLIPSREPRQTRTVSLESHHHDSCGVIVDSRLEPSISIPFFIPFTCP